ncbi:MAG: PTS sugar transporter subunit IIC [Eubacteriales bacterium]
MANKNYHKQPRQKVPVKKQTRSEKMISFLKRAGKRYFIDAMGAMVYGLFASLLIGTILKTIFGFIHIDALQPYFQQIIYWTSAGSPLVGAAIGVAVATGLKSKPLAVYSAAVVGGLAYLMNAFDVVAGTPIKGVTSAGPMGAIIAVIVAVEIGSWLTGKTPFDLIVVPAGAVISGTVVAVLVGPPVGSFMAWLGWLLVGATKLYPFPMGIAVSLLVGLTLVAPISSAALCISMGLNGLAAGAATVGCCAQMVGFAVASFRENGWNGLLSQGLGTAKIQFPNIVRHPQILIPTMLASAVAGPLATCVFGMTNNFLGAGMGSCGLVGQIMTFSNMTVPTDGSAATAPWVVVCYIIILQFILPAAIAFLTSEIMRKKGWIKFGDMKLVKE